jgi:undecaprenyl diphosphate synthase
MLRLFRDVVFDSYALVPGLVSLSLFSPELPRLIASPPAASDRAAWREDFAALAGAAADRGALFLCLGDTEALPGPGQFTSAASPPGGDATRFVNFFFAYSGREEIARAATRCLEDHPDGEVDEEVFSGHLLTAGQPDPDLILYAGGSLEPKDFLIWQASYAEIWHSPGNGLDFSRKDLVGALEDFRARQRRFGAV